MEIKVEYYKYNNTLHLINESEDEKSAPNESEDEESVLIFLGERCYESATECKLWLTWVLCSIGSITVLSYY
jgi:hypothetical protein